MLPLRTSQHGVWQSIDLLLAFLILQTTLVMALSPLFLEQTYAHERAVNDMRLSSLLSLSHRIYTSAVMSTGPAGWVGYFEPSSLSPTALGLPDSYASQLSSLLSNSPLPPSTDRLCIQRTMLYQNRVHALRLCSPAG